MLSLDLPGRVCMNCRSALGMRDPRWGHYVCRACLSAAVNYVTLYRLGVVDADKRRKILRGSS